MKIYKRISYVQTRAGWQTYIHPVGKEFLRFKLLSTQSELTAAIARGRLENNNLTVTPRSLTTYR